MRLEKGYYSKYGICDMIKGNESDVGNIDFGLWAERGDKFIGLFKMDKYFILKNQNRIL